MAKPTRFVLNAMFVDTELFCMRSMLFTSGASAYQE
jgi:hypothetical protein